MYLQTLHVVHDWSVSEISAAITLHFILSAVVIAYLPEIHARLGIAKTTWAGSLLTFGGLVGWASASEIWHLYVAAIPTAIGWAVTSGAALNAIVAPWFDRDRPKAIGLAFNGASIGGVVFVPLWILLIDQLSFLGAALAVGVSMIALVSVLAATTLRSTPSDRGLQPDGEAAAAAAGGKPGATTSRARLLGDIRFVTISAAFALGLFAQIGLLAHLVVRLSPEVGVSAAGAMVSMATICAVIGRTLLGSIIGDHDRRVAAAINFAVQIAGVCFLAFGSGWTMLVIGCALFGLGVGNLVSLPPLLIQKEFDRVNVPVAVALVVAINQAVFAFAPAIFGLIRDVTDDYSMAFLLGAAAQGCAIVIVLAGRRSAA